MPSPPPRPIPKSQAAMPQNEQLSPQASPWTRVGKVNMDPRMMVSQTTFGFCHNLICRSQSGLIVPQVHRLPAADKPIPLWCTPPYAKGIHEELGALNVLWIQIICACCRFRTLAFLVWVTVAWPCCRLRRDDSVFDAFEREALLACLGDRGERLVLSGIGVKT